MDNNIFYLIVLVGSLLLASFYSVVIYRVPRKESIVSPGSHCTACGARLGILDLIPIFGWLSAGGKCRHCGAKLPFRYLLLELLVPLLLLSAAWRDGAGWLFLRDAIFLSLLVILSFIDLDTMELPHRFTLPGMVSGVIFAIFGVTAAREIYWSHAVLGLAIGYLLPSLLSALYKMVRGRAGMGGGDFMLLAMIGAHTGPAGVLVSFMAAVVLGAVIGIILMSRVPKQERAQLAIPFGPYLALGGVIALFWGNQLLAAYHAWMIGR